MKAISRYIKKEMKKKSTEEDDAPKPKKIKEVYTLRDVIKQNYKALVEAEIPYKSTDKEYLGSYQRAVTTVLANMDQEDLDEVQNILDAWNDQGAPPEVQLKWVDRIFIYWTSKFHQSILLRRAKTKLPKEIRKKLDDWKFSSGAVILCLVAFSDGQNVQTFQ